MDDDNSSLDLALHNALTVVLVRIVIDQSEVLVLARRIVDTKICDLTSRHTGKAVWDDIAHVLLGRDQTTEQNGAPGKSGYEYFRTHLVSRHFVKRYD